MTVSPEDDGAAAEFALGTLDAGERATLAARRLREPELDAAIRAWEELLAPLAEAVVPIDPPRDDLAAIEARLAAARSSAGVVALQRRLARWRAAAIGAASVAAMLCAAVVIIETALRTPPAEFTAFLQKNAEAPAFVLSMDAGAREMTVRPLGAEPQPGKSYELWLIEPRLGAPRSLGVISPSAVTRRQFASFDLAIAENATYAVTLEPPGGSPNGAPSGPPVFVGKLVRITE